jgi:uncharacterized SAM-binding protein YcdF (DUF218 family)
VYTPYVEAKIMALYGEALGIAPDHIYVEGRAEHSTENIYYSYYLAKEKGFKKIAVATDPFQTRMLRSYPRKERLKVAFLPMIIDTLKKMDKKEPKIDYQQAKASNFKSIIDRESRWKRVRGTMGKNVKRVENDNRTKRRINQD